MRPTRTGRVAALLAAIACAAGAFPDARAQAPAQAAASPRFTIQQFEVTGNTLLPADEIEFRVAPYTGENREFGDVQRALDAIEAAYRDLGYAVVQVLLPEQDITQGIVRIRVIEPRVGKVAIEGNTHFDDDNIRRSLPAVREGETPNSNAIARNLQLTGEHPIKQTYVLLRAGATENEVDVAVRVADDKPWRVFVTLDNTGASETGNARLGIGAQHSNLFNRDHILTGQYVTSPTEPDQVSIYGLGYRVPFYRLNSSLDLIAGYSDVDSGTVQGLFNVSGSGSIAIVRWNMVLPRWGSVEQKLSFGLDYRAFDNEVLFEGSPSIVPDITIRPASVNYAALWRGAGSELSYYGNYSRNIPGGKNGTEEEWRSGSGSRQDVVDDYQILRYGFNVLYQFRSEWQVRLGFNGQHTRDPLVSGEQYGIGGPDTVRGYLVRELAKDKGYSSQLELYTPIYSPSIGLPSSLQLRVLGFYDYGSVKNNNTEPSDEEWLASTGVGLRLSYGKLLSLRLDVARILKETANREEGSYHASAALALIF